MRNIMIDPGESFINSIGHDNVTPIWSGQAIWAHYLLDINIFPRSRNANLSDWEKFNSKSGYNGGISRLNSRDNMMVNIQIFYTRPSWNSSHLPFITEEVKNAFFGEASFRQSVHIVMKMSTGSSNFVAHIEGANAYIFGFAIVPAQSGEGLVPYNLLRPLVIDLKSDSVVRRGNYYYFKAWILNEASIIPFFRFVSLKAETDNKFGETSAHSSSPFGVPFHRPPHPPTSSSELPSPYSNQIIHPHGMDNPYAPGFYDAVQRQQNAAANKYVQNMVQKALGSPVIKPIPMYPANESSQVKSNYYTDQQLHNVKGLGIEIEFSSDSLFKANQMSDNHRHFRNRYFKNEVPHTKASNINVVTTQSHLHDSIPKNRGKSMVGGHHHHHHYQPPNTGHTSSSSESSQKQGNSSSSSSSFHEKYLSEFIYTLFNWQDDVNQTLNLLDKIVPLLISIDGEDNILFDKVHDLFRTFYKGQKNASFQEHERAWEVKIELQFINTLKKCPYNFKHDLATHLLKERDNLISKQKKKEKERRKKISEAIVKSEEYTMKKKTIGVFSGNFNDKLVHFSTIILENISAPQSQNLNPFSNLFCLFISKHIPFFSWDKWKDNKVILSSASSKMRALFDLDDPNLKQFLLDVNYMKNPDDFDAYISSAKDDDKNKKACLISFTNFYQYFQKIEKVHKVEPLITWKPIIFSKPPIISNPSAPSTSTPKQCAFQKSKEQDPFYGLLMSVFGNRVYGLSYRKRIKLKFDFSERANIQYHALIFNNNIVFISDATASDFLPEIDNLIFGCETFETFLIKNDRIPAFGISVLKLKIPITSRKVNPLKDSQGNNTSIIPNVLIKAKILDNSQLNNLDFLKMEIFDGESFIVERKQSLITFQNTLKGRIKYDEVHPHPSNVDFRMMRKIRTIAKMRVFMRNTFFDLIIFYFISFTKSEGSELVFVNNSEDEIIGRSIDVMISPLSENMLRLVSKSNFTSSVLLTRKDKSTWAMITDINEPIRCIGRIVMPNASKNIIWEAIGSKDMFFSDMDNIRSALSSPNKYCTTKSWVKLYGIDEQSFNDFHLSNESLEPWDYSLDNFQLSPPPFESRKEKKKAKRAHRKKLLTLEKDSKTRNKESEDPLKIHLVNSLSLNDYVNNQIKKRKSHSEEVEDISMEIEVSEPIAQSMPLKKRFLRTNSPTSSLSSSSPPLTIDIDCDEETENLPQEPVNETKEESDMSPKVIIHENDRRQADRYLKDRLEGSVITVDSINDEDDEVINAIKCIVNDIEQNGGRTNKQTNIKLT